jgi:hypothetical protein
MILGPDIPGLTFQEERFSDLRIEASLLFEEHWQEAGHRSDKPVDMDWAAYRAMEDSGILLTITARYQGRLVGYAVYVLWRHPHHRSVTVADCDCVFIESGRRQGRAAMRFMQHVENALRSRGIQEVHTPIRPVNRTSRGDRSLVPLMVRMGYRLQSLVYGKVLADG